MTSDPGANAPAAAPAPAAAAAAALAAAAPAATAHAVDPASAPAPAGRKRPRSDTEATHVGDKKTAEAVARAASPARRAAHAAAAAAVNFAYGQLKKPIEQLELGTGRVIARFESHSAAYREQVLGGLQLDRGPR